MAFLTPDKTRVEHELVIKEKIIPWGCRMAKDYKGYKKGDKYKADRLLSGGTGKVAYVTIRNTADIEEAKGTNDAEQCTPVLCVPMPIWAMCVCTISLMKRIAAAAP